MTKAEQFKETANKFTMYLRTGVEGFHRQALERAKAWGFDMGDVAAAAEYSIAKGGDR
jgi:hypothetical protein